MLVTAMTVSDTGRDADGGVDVPVGDQPILCAEVETVEGGRRCTIFPEEALTVSRTERWVTAEGSAFVDLSTRR